MISLSISVPAASISLPLAVAHPLWSGGTHDYLRCFDSNLRKYHRCAFPFADFYNARLVVWNWREEKKVAEKELDRRRAASSEKGDAATSVIFAESDFTRLTTCGESKLGEFLCT